RWAPLRIRPRRHIPARLVEQDVAETFGGPDPAPVDTDIVARWIGFRSKLAHCLAVHRHAAFRHEFLSGATRGDSRLGEDFLETDHHQEWLQASGFRLWASGGLRRQAFRKSASYVTRRLIAGARRPRTTRASTFRTR